MTSFDRTPKASRPRDVAQLHADIAAFKEEMRQAESAGVINTWVSFGIGAAIALGVFVVVTLLQRGA